MDQNESKTLRKLRNLFSRVDALCREYLTKCHFKKEDAENLALVMKELPKVLKYHLSMLEGFNNGMRSWHWVKIKLVHFRKLLIKICNKIDNASTRDT